MGRMASVADVLPYSSHVEPGVIRLTGGELMTTLELSGLPAEGLSADDLRRHHDEFERTIRSLKGPDHGHFALWAHQIKRREIAKSPAPAGSASIWERSLCRARGVQEQGAYTVRNYLTLIHRPPPLRASRLRNAQDCARAVDSALVTHTEHLAALESGLMSYRPSRLQVFNESGQLMSMPMRFLATLLGHSHCVGLVPAGPIRHHLLESDWTFDAQSATWSWTDTSLPAGCGAMLQVREYPTRTAPGMLSSLADLPIEYVQSQSFSPLGRQQALTTLDRAKSRLWAAGDRAVSQIAELDQAMDALSGGGLVFGEYHYSLAVRAESRQALETVLADARAELTRNGLVSVRETHGALPAYLAQFPGNWRYRPRVAVISSQNATAFSAPHGEYLGKADGNPWGQAVCAFRTRQGQLHHFSFHPSEPGRDANGELVLGNTLIIGKSGVGKTVLMNYLLANTLLLEPRPRLFLFDKDRASRAFIERVGGRYLELRYGQTPGLNPLVLATDPAHRGFLLQWLAVLTNRSEWSQLEEQELRIALDQIALAEPEHRTLTNLRVLLPNRGDQCLYAALHRWTKGQSLGWVFDQPGDYFEGETAPIIGVDCTDLLNDPSIRVPLVSYLLFRLEQLLDGHRLIYAIDEFWRILDGHEELSAFIRNKQKTIRKQNGLGLFATQSPDDALASSIASSLIEQTATLLLLPNPGATREEYCNGLRLSQEEFERVRSLGESSRQFLIKQRGLSAVCRLDLYGQSELLDVLSGVSKE